MNAMDRFTICFRQSSTLFMEGALGERLKREEHILFDPHVAMAGLIYEERPREALRRLWNEYIGIAEKYGFPCMVTTPTRRANRERVAHSHFTNTIIQDNVRFLQDFRAAAKKIPLFIGGLMGCRGDAYTATDVLSVREAEAFHSWLAEAFGRAGADFLFAGIMPALSEAVGMARAMERTGLPYILSFMIRKTGMLPDGSTIHEAVSAIDAATERQPLCYMTNCVYPDVACQALTRKCNLTDAVRQRFCGIQANASPLSPEELDNAETLYRADSMTLAEAVLRLNDVIRLKIVGGCCGTDGKHMDEIAKRLSFLRLSEGKEHGRQG